MPRDQRCRRPQRLPPQPVYVNGAGPVRQAVSDATSAGRVPPRCTARGSRNSARREHLILSDRRREAEQATACHRNHRRKTPRRSAGETGDRRARGSILDSRPDRHLNSIPAPGIEANHPAALPRAARPVPGCSLLGRHVLVEPVTGPTHGGLEERLLLLLLTGKALLGDGMELRDVNLDLLHAIHGTLSRTPLLRAFTAGQDQSTTARWAPLLSLAVPASCPKGHLWVMRGRRRPPAGPALSRVEEVVTSRNDRRIDRPLLPERPS